jgi:hypothetical protein
VGEFRLPVLKRIPAILLLVTLALPLGAAVEEDHDHDHPETARVTPDPAERIHSLEVDYEIHRDGVVSFEQRFKLGVAGVAIRRGPVLNYLTVFQGPGGLVLDTELEILEVTRDGTSETFRADYQSGFLSLYLGDKDRDLEHRDHDYVIKGRMREDWRRGEGEFSTVIDLVGALPTLPIDAAVATVRLPEGVPVLRYTPSVTGVDPEAERHGPAWRAEAAGNRIRVEATAPMGENRSFFLNLAWPSATFATKSQWMLVMKQHPRLPLAAFSGLVLCWALLLLVRRMVRR